MGAGATTTALFFAGGCGMDTAPPRQDGAAAAADGGKGHKLGPEIVRDGAGGGGVVDPDVPLLLKNCRATDAVDVFSLAAAAAAAAAAASGKGEEGEDVQKAQGSGKGSGNGAGLPLVASDGLRSVLVLALCLVVVAC